MAVALRHVVGSDRARNVELPEVIPDRSIAVGTVHNRVTIGDLPCGVAGRSRDAFEIAPWVTAEQIAIEAVAPYFIHRPTGRMSGTHELSYA